MNNTIEKIMEGEATKYFYNHRNFVWYKNHPSSIHNLRYFIEYINKKRLANKPLEILSVGCGSGINLTILSSFFPRFKYFGIDLSPYGIKTAKKHARGTYQIGDIENIDYRKESFDIVLCISVIHHFKKINKMISEIHRILKPNGLLLIHEPLGKNPKFYFPYFLFKNLLIRDYKKKINSLPNQITHDRGLHPDQLFKKKGINIFRAKKTILKFFTLQEEYEKDYLTFWAIHKKLGFNLALEFDRKYLIKGTKYIGIYQKGEKKNE